MVGGLRDGITSVVGSGLRLDCLFGGYFGLEFSAVVGVESAGLEYNSAGPPVVPALGSEGPSVGFASMQRTSASQPDIDLQLPVTVIAVLCLLFADLPPRKICRTHFHKDISTLPVKEPACVL